MKDVPYITPSTVKEIGDRWYDLNQKISEFLSNSKYSEQDARHDILNTIRWLIFSVLMRMSVLVSLDERVITEEQIREAFRIYSGDLKTALEFDSDFTRMAFVTVFQFQVENLFKIILSRLDEQTVPRKYSCVVERLLKILNLNNKDRQDKLSILAYVRNCLHSNGIHSNENRTFVIDDCTFEFVKGRSFNNAGWGEIHYMTKTAFDVIREILESDKVKQIPQPLPNQFFLDDNDA